MPNLMKIKIVSIDGKVFEDDCEALYLDIPQSGAYGILANHTPFVALLHIGNFHYVKDNKSYTFAISGGTINFKNNVATILADTFERDDELDKARILKKKEEMEEKINTIQAVDSVEYENAMFSLKKALNRLKILR